MKPFSNVGFSSVPANYFISSKRISFHFLFLLFVQIIPSIISDGFYLKTQKIERLVFIYGWVQTTASVVKQAECLLVLISATILLIQPMKPRNNVLNCSIAVSLTGMVRTEMRCKRQNCGRLTRAIPNIVQDACTEQTKLLINLFASSNCTKVTVSRRSLKR